ncbi:MAG: methyltransferase domain-containing protein [bacterium]|nr:methyltransferase domain-containing protein [bacterium]
MSLRFHEIAESNHRIQNPLSLEKLRLLGELCHAHEGMRVLDLACGKGELLCQWAAAHNIIGIGVDISAVFIEAAQKRAFELDVFNQLTFVEADAGDYPQEHHQFDLISCMGATWIGGGLVGTLNLMATALKPNGGWLLVGEPYWAETPSDEVAKVLGVQVDEFATLEGTLDRFESAGLELVDMTLSSLDEWDRYIASQWNTIYQWLDENEDDPDAADLRRWIQANRRIYLTTQRQTMGWGAFVLKAQRKATRQASSTSSYENPSRPVAVEFSDGFVWVSLLDGRVIGNPLAWYPWLENAPQDEQEAFDLDTFGINWRTLGQRLEVDALLRGKG